MGGDALVGPMSLVVFTCIASSASYSTAITRRLQQAIYTYGLIEGIHAQGYRYK